MLKLESNDFVPVESFTLRWRWTDPKHNLLPPNQLALIRPLAAAKATELDFITRRIAEPIPANAMTLDSSSNQNVREWLARTLPFSDSDLLVSWSRDTAVQSDRDVFIEYWDDFCYPSSDDVVVVPLAGDWVLLYKHDETLCFWKRNSPPP